jgi:hypothetical protein
MSFDGVILLGRTTKPKEPPGSRQRFRRSWAANHIT